VNFRKFWFGFALFCAAGLASAASLEEIKARGRISFAVYNDFPPFHEKGKGIEIDLGHAIAEKMGVKASFLPFDASDEKIEDDLRHTVWRGHFMGWGPADAMFHVPVTSELMRENPQVRVIAPYYSERLAIARNVKTIPNLDSLDVFQKEKIGAEMASISSHLMITASGGKYTGNVRHFRFPAMAVGALKQGEIAAVIAQRSELQALLFGSAGFAISDAPFPPSPQTGWPVGLAVTKANEALATAIGEAIALLKSSGEMQKIFGKYGVIAP
jgi:ABC-type amino acid transport substrate-binding protein